MGPGIIFRGTLPRRTLTYVSPNVEQVLGYPSDELVGTPDWWSDHLHPDDRVQLVEAADEAARRSATAVGDTLQRVRHRDGRYVWFHTVVRYVRDEHGRAIGFLGAAVPLPESERAHSGLVAGPVGFGRAIPSRD